MDRGRGRITTEDLDSGCLNGDYRVRSLGRVIDVPSDHVVRVWRSNLSREDDTVPRVRVLPTSLIRPTGVRTVYTPWFSVRVVSSLVYHCHCLRLSCRFTTLLFIDLLVWIWPSHFLFFRRTSFTVDSTLTLVLLLNRSFSSPNFFFLLVHLLCRAHFRGSTLPRAAPFSTFNR